jgi:hypothetical protein
MASIVYGAKVKLGSRGSLEPNGRRCAGQKIEKRGTKPRSALESTQQSKNWCKKTVF